MKKFFSLISALIIFCRITTVSFASDWENHWASDNINILISKSIVSGDEQGNINPDKPIKRSECVKVINKILNLTQTGANNLKDIDETKWYYNDFLIAQKAGYIKGDNNGYANPEKNVTRAELCVMLQRAMGISDTPYELSFSDVTDIPSWAAEAIYLLAKKDLIHGFPDGSFRPSSGATRAEVFTIVCGIIKAEQPPQDEITSIANAPVSKPAATSSRSGGGGGGGSSSMPKKLNTPIIIRLDENNGLSWKKVQYASYYEVTVECGEKSAVINTSNTSIDLNPTIDEITSDIYLQQAELKAYLKAFASAGISPSEYSKEIIFTKTLYDPDIAGNFDFELSAKTDEDEEKYEIIFSDTLINIVIAYNDKTEIIPNPVSPLDITGYLKDGNDFISDVVNISGVNASGSKMIVFSPLYGGGDGTEQTPYIISSARHFKNIAKNPGAYFIQTKDINLGSDFTNMYLSGQVKFSGNYSTESAGLKINADISSADGYASLFGYAENASISGITFEGTISASEKYNGAIAGYAENTSITNCINSADIDLSGEAVSGFTGGIAGYIKASNINDCENNGKISSSAAFCGGICAVASGSKITNSVNKGDVLASNTAVSSAEDCCAGGITGDVSDGSEISDCSNQASVTNNFSISNNAGIKIFTGGIAGRLSGSSVLRCINLKGAGIISPIISGTPTIILQAGGIVGRAQNDSAVSYCKNYAPITMTATTQCWPGGICGGANKTLIENCASHTPSVISRQFGGICGRGEAGSTVRYCYNTSTLSALPGFCGGIACQAWSTFKIEDSFNTGYSSGNYAAAAVGYLMGEVELTNFYSATESALRNALICQKNASAGNLIINNSYYLKKGSETDILNSDAGTDAEEIIKAFSQLENWTIDDSEGYLLPQLISNPYEE